MAPESRPVRRVVILADPAETQDFTRKALPWLGAMTFHAVLLAVSVTVVIVRYEPPLPASPVEIALAAAPPEPSGSSGPADGPVLQSSSSGLGIPVPMNIAEVTRVSRPVATADSRPRMPPIAAASGEGLGSMAQPSPDDVLADLPSASRQQPEGQVGWVEGAARRILVRHDPQFPRILAAAGTEVECTARITVSPTGAVTRVEITRSSGYTEVDTGVEAALREFLFSRVEGGNEAVGTITFRFRLEKRD